MSNLTPSMLPGAEPTLTVPGIFQHPMPVADAVLAYAGPGGAPKTGTGIVTEPVYHLAGTIGAGINDTFYNRILIEPTLLALGNLLSTQQRSIIVWNGFLASKMLSNFQTSNASGINVTQPVVPPYTLRPLELLTYTVAITLDGPAQINAGLTWTIGGTDYTAQITGSRVVVFPFAPHWSNDFTESLEWKTNVIRAYDGSEQRRSLRTKPRRNFSFVATLFGRSPARLESMLWGWQNRQFAIPVWSDRTRLPNTQNAGDTSITLSTSSYSFAAGGMLILYANETSYEVAEIDTVSSGAILLKRPLGFTWPKGTSIIPIVLGHMPTEVSITRHIDDKLSANLQFSTSPDMTDPYMPDAAPATTYDGYEVLLRQPNWSGALDNTFGFEFGTVDGNTGPLAWLTTEKYPRLTRRYTWLFDSRNNILLFRQLLARLRGQAKPILIPTWHQDFVVTKDIGTTDDFVEVYDDGFQLLVGVDPTRSRLVLRLKDGTMIFRKITGLSSPNPGRTSIKIDTQWGRQIKSTDIKALNLLVLMRLATDQVEIVWKSDSVATIDTSFISVPA
jgi:hypothetical protein